MRAGRQGAVCQGRLSGQAGLVLLMGSWWHQHAGSAAGSSNWLRSTAGAWRWRRRALTGLCGLLPWAVWLKPGPCPPTPAPLQGLRCVGPLPPAANGAARPGRGAAAEGQGLQGGWRCLRAVGPPFLGSHKLLEGAAPAAGGLTSLLCLLPHVTLSSAVILTLSTAEALLL